MMTRRRNVDEQCAIALQCSAHQDETYLSIYNLSAIYYENKIVFNIRFVDLLRVQIFGVNIGRRALERQTIIVSICNVACSVRSNPEAVYNLLYSVSCHRRCQWCVCVLSSPWWSGLAKP